MTGTLANLRWDNTFARLPDAFFERVSPTPLPDPYLVAVNPDVAALLDLDPAELTRPEFVDAINRGALTGAEPVAAIYAGHQFGVWVPQLGDGRAILLGEVVNRRHERWDVQLKGAGMTRFSRMGDGRAVLRSTIREYLAGEAMHGLGIPTTRSLAIIGSDAPVYREDTETAAILVRVAPTHVRFGSFEVFASRAQHEEVKRLADYVIALHFPGLLVLPVPGRYLAWFREVVQRTARLMANWMATGFTHGVMNTDNMSILGFSLDYGPYGWLDEFERGFIPNHSDPAGRYAYDQQPKVGLWNCVRLGEALLSLISEAEVVDALNAYREAFETELDRLMRAKLGFVSPDAGDITLVADLLALLHDTRADYTRVFRVLSRYTHGDADHVGLRVDVADADRLAAWLRRYDARLAAEHSVDSDRHARMLRSNPKFILRNWMAQEAITNAQARNYGPIEQLRELLSAPFDEHPEFERYADRPPEWARSIALSCSS